MQLQYRAYLERKEEGWDQIEMGFKWLRKDVGGELYFRKTKVGYSERNELE